MRTKKLLWLIVLALLGHSRDIQAQGPQQWTTTILAVDASKPSGPSGLLWVQNDPRKEIVLKLDLNALPAGFDPNNLVRCTLRLVADKVVFDQGPTTGGQLVIVKGRTGADANSPTIVSLSTLTPTKKVALQSNDALCKVVSDKYGSGDKVLSLTLFTESHKASTTFYSPSNFDQNPSNMPRLVLEYMARPPGILETLSWSQRQHDPEHTGRNPWVPFTAPAGFTIQKVDLPPILDDKGNLVSGGAIADYPQIYGGNIYLIYQAARNYLVCVDFTGRNKLWQKDIGTGTIQRSPVISRQGVLYAVTEQQIAAYDLNRNGEPAASYPLTGKLSDYTDLTSANDGSLYLALKQDTLNYIYGFTPKLAPFLRAGPFRKRISTITANVQGNEIFAETEEGGVVIDVSNPSRQVTHSLPGAWEYYNTPLAGPAGGVMIFSDFTSTANRGDVRGYGSKQIWISDRKTLIPQPVLGTNELVYFIQGSKLLGQKYNKVWSPAIDAGSGLSTTSNLVMDGANNIYFWDNGKFYGFKADGTALFAPIVAAQSVQERKGEGPETFVRLSVAPDGTVWTNNKNEGGLFAFQPTYAQNDLTITNKDLVTQTSFRATRKLTVIGTDAVLQDRTVTLFEAGNSISFSGGFRVQNGASLLCRIGP